MLFWKDRAICNHFYMPDGGEGGDGGENKEEKVTMTKAELEAYAQKVADKRVSEGIKTNSEKLKSDYETQLKQLNDKLKGIEEKGLDEKTLYEKRQKELDDLITSTKRDKNKAKAEALFAKNNIVSDDLDSIVDSVVDIDENTTIEKANKIISAFNKIVSSQVASKYEETIKKNPAPKNDDKTAEPMTAERFAKLSYAEQYKYKEKYPEQVKGFMKK